MSGGALQSKSTIIRTTPTKDRLQPDPDARAGAELPPDTIGYIAALCAELSAMARMGGCPDLAYFLEMARVEAASALLQREERLVNPGRKG